MSFDLAHVDNERLALVLGKLSGVKRCGASYIARCPAHDDREASLSVALSADGSKVLTKCFAGCTFDQIAASAGLSATDFFAGPSRTTTNVDSPRSATDPNRRSRARVTLAELAEHKRLPVDFLRGLGWTDGFSGVAIAYRCSDGSVHRNRIRSALAAKDGSSWGPGEGMIAYEPDRGELRRVEHEVIVVEGETDTATLLYAGFAALGVPGATAYGVLSSEHFADVKRVYVVQEPDAAGEAFVRGVRSRVDELGVQAELFVLRMPDNAKDPSALYQRDPAAFADRMRSAMQASRDQEDATQSADPERPLLGLERLQRIAVYGLDAVLALAAVAVAYVWQDIAVAGTIVLIAGGPSEGKTTLLFMVLVARATLGGPVLLLERYVAPAPPLMWIVLIEGEHSEHSTAAKLVKTAKLMNVGIEAIGRFIIIARKAVVVDSPEWAQVCELIKRGHVSDIAIDTIARVAPADANDEREQVQMFGRVAAAIDLAPPGVEKPVVWAAAHTKKSATGDLTDVSGSTQRVGQADTVLLVKGTKVDGRTVSSRVTFAKLREEPDEYPLPVDFAIERDGSGRPVLRMGGVVRDEQPLTVRILDLLRARGALSKNALRAELKRNRSDVEAAITELFKHKRLRTVVKEIRGKETTLFALAPVPEVSPDFSPDLGGNE